MHSTQNNSRPLFETVPQGFLAEPDATGNREVATHDQESRYFLKEWRRPPSKRASPTSLCPSLPEANLVVRSARPRSLGILTGPYPGPSPPVPDPGGIEAGLVVGFPETTTLVNPVLLPELGLPVAGWADPADTGQVGDEPTFSAPVNTWHPRIQAGNPTTGGIPRKGVSRPSGRPRCGSLRGAADATPR